MSVFIFDENVLDKIDQAEWGLFKEAVERGVLDQHSIFGLYRFLEEWKKIDAELGKKITNWREIKQNPNDPSYKIYEITWIEINNESTSIYGYGGWHRYLINYLGEIIAHDGFFSELSPDEELQLARQSGFRIFSEMRK